jgi:hypothetical protein
MNTLNKVETSFTISTKGFPLFPMVLGLNNCDNQMDSLSKELIQRI